MPPTRTEAHAQLCGHYKAALTLALRDLGEVARRAACAEQKGSPKLAKLIELLQDRKADLAKIKETIAVSGGTCQFCKEHGHADS